MGKGRDPRAVYVRGLIGAFHLLRKNDGNVHMYRRRHSNGNTGGLDREDFRNSASGIKACHLRAELHQKIDVELLVEKASDLQNIPAQNDAVACNALFQKLHPTSLPQKKIKKAD